MAKLTQALNSTTNISIVSTNDLFSIDSKTGWVVTNADFYYDYDNFDFDDETNLVELSIKASDKAGCVAISRLCRNLNFLSSH